MDISRTIAVGVLALPLSGAAWAEDPITPINPDMMGAAHPAAEAKAFPVLDVKPPEERKVVGELVTPPLPAGGTNLLECIITNVSARARAVRVQAFSGTGSAVGDLGTQTLAQGGSTGFSIPASSGAAYCKFTVEGSGKEFRASVSVMQPGVGTISALSAE